MARRTVRVSHGATTSVSGCERELVLSEGVVLVGTQKKEKKKKKEEEVGGALT